jgi:hypothetical protein
MKRWKDISSYSRSDDKSEVKSVELIAGRIRLAVTRHIHNPGKWHLNCDALRYTYRELESDELEAAKAEALTIVKADLADALADVK